MGKMKLFLFYPDDYTCRMYVMAENLEDLKSRADDLFALYIAEEKPGYFMDDPEDEEDIREFREKFDKGIQAAEVLTSGVAIDSHY
jgi:hypothetical protein